MNSSTAKLEPIGEYRRPWFPPPIKSRVNPFLLPTQVSTPLANTPPSTEPIIDETLATPVSSISKTRYQSYPSPTIEKINTPDTPTQNQQYLSTPKTFSPPQVVKQTPKPTPRIKSQQPTTKDLREKAKQIGFARYWKLKKDVLKEFIDAYERTGIIPEQVRSLKRVGVSCDFDTECYSKKCKDKKCDGSDRVRVRKAIKPLAPLPPPTIPKSTPSTRKNPKKKQAKETLASCVITCVSKHGKQRRV